MASRTVGYAQAAQYLGISIGALRRRVSRGTVPHRLRPALGGIKRRVVRFDLEELDRWADGEPAPPKVAASG